MPSGSPAMQIGLDIEYLDAQEKKEGTKEDTK